VAAAQLSTFLRHVESDRLAGLWRLAAATGMRRGELAGLRWSDVDLDAGSLTIRQTLTVVAGRPRFDEPKTATSRRTLTLDTDTRSALRSHRARQASERLAAGDIWQDHDLVFASENGAPLNLNTISRNFDRLVQRAGLPRITLHGIRHAYLTMLLRDGVPLKVVSQRAGHASLAVTTTVYNHAMPGYDQAVAEASRRLLAGS
jgi:integrase